MSDLADKLWNTTVSPADYTEPGVRPSDSAGTVQAVPGSIVSRHQARRRGCAWLVRCAQSPHVLSELRRGTYRNRPKDSGFTG